MLLMETLVFSTFSYYFYNCTTSFFSDNYFFFNENSHLGMMSVAIVLSGAYIFFSQNNSNIYKYLFIAYAVTTFIIYSTTYSISAIICSLFFSVYFLIVLARYLLDEKNFLTLDLSD